MKFEYDIVVGELAGEFHLCQVDITPPNVPLEAPVQSCCRVATARVHVNGEPFYICADHLARINEVIGQLPPKAVEDQPHWK